MEKQDLEDKLRVLVELDLYERIRSIREGNFPNQEEMIKTTIQSFEKALPKWTNQISDCHSIVIDTLEKTEREMIRINNMRQNENNKNQKDER